MSEEMWVKSDQSGIVVVTLNRPERRNALSISLIEGLRQAIAAAEKEKRVLVLRGNGAGFCAGMDLKQTAEIAAAERGAELLLELFEALAGSAMVTIAAVHGAMLAGGAALAACCDLLIAGEDLRVGFPETQRGLVPALAACLVGRKVGDAAMRELFLAGRMIDAGRAMQMGLVNGVVPNEKLEEEAMALARDVLRGGPQAVGQTKRLLEELRPRPLHEALRQAVDFHIAARRSAEAQEGIAAFVEKRAPRWQTLSGDRE